MIAEHESCRDHECLKSASVVAMLRAGRSGLVAVPLVCPACGRGPEHLEQGIPKDRISKVASKKHGRGFCPVCLRG